MTCGTLERIPVAEIDRVLESSVRRPDGLPGKSLIQGRVAYRAVVADHLALFAPVLAVVAAEAALCVEVADVVDVAGPIRLHLGEEVRLIDPLYLSYRRVDGVFFSVVYIGVVRAVEIVDVGSDRAHRLVVGVIGLGQRLSRRSFQEGKRDVEFARVE